MNKFLCTIIILGFAVLGLSGCNDSAQAGSSALKPGDNISVKADTFAIQSQLSACSPIYMTPDSFLLGECETHFGKIKADILTQFACPVGFNYPHPENAEVDSVCLYLFYQSWYGDGFAPLGVTVYEMDREQLSYDEGYPSDAIVEQYCSLHDSVHIGPQRIFYAAEAVDSTYSSTTGLYVPYLSIKLSKKFAERFFAIRDFSSQDAFNNLFHGLYITSDFGGATIFYVTDISMMVFYHFTYQLSEGQDTTVQDSKAFYSNSEVKQINRYFYPDRAKIIQLMNQYQDTTFVVAPANIYTSLRIPMTRIHERMEEQLGNPENYRVYVNRANLTVDVFYNEYATTRPRDNWDKPAPYMLLIQEEEFQSFFSDHMLPTDTASVLSALGSVTDSMDITSYYYTYDLSNMLTCELRQSQPKDTLNLLLVPVEVVTAISSSGTTGFVEVNQAQSISATMLRSASNSTDPLNLELVYSGFNTTKR